MASEMSRAFMDVHYIKPSRISSPQYLLGRLRCKVLNLLGRQPGSEGSSRNWESWVRSSPVAADVPGISLSVSGLSGKSLEMCSFQVNVIPLSS